VVARAPQAPHSWLHFHLLQNPCGFSGKRGLEHQDALNLFHYMLSKLVEKWKTSFHYFHEFHYFHHFHHFHEHPTCSVSCAGWRRELVDDATVYGVAVDRAEAEQIEAVATEQM
jgi:hypothetical protein